jgi:hypothetical protein
MMEEKLKELFEWCFEQVSDGCDINGGDFQDKAEALGILVKKTIPQEAIDAEPEKYEKCLEFETNELYFPAWNIPNDL